jgi:hypothetical protein
MRVLNTLSVALLFSVTACGSGNDTGSQAVNASAPAAQRGGTITVGETTWTVVPATQCSVYPGNVVAIAGHLADDPGVEVIIDRFSDGPGDGGARIGPETGDNSWHAMPDTLVFAIDGKRVRGTATFNRYFSGTGDSAEGSFDVNCG